MKLVSIFLTLLLLASLSSLALKTSAGSEVHDVAVIDVTVFPKKVLVMGTITINATVQNQGTNYETFNVTIYAGNHTLTYPPLTVVDLAPGLNVTLTKKWEIYPVRVMIFPPPWPYPSKPMVENLTVRVEADIVAGEEDISDNVYIGETVTIIWCPPDVNGDGKIDIRDIASVAKAFGTSTGDPRWDPTVDFNSDGKIDIADIASSARIFGTAYG